MRIAGMHAIRPCPSCRLVLLAVVQASLHGADEALVLPTGINNGGRLGELRPTFAQQTAARCIRPGIRGRRPAARMLPSFAAPEDGAVLTDPERSKDNQAPGKTTCGSFLEDGLCESFWTDSINRAPTCSCL